MPHKTGLDPRVPHFPRLIVFAGLHCTAPYMFPPHIYFPLLQHSSEMDPFFLASAVNISSSRKTRASIITVLHCRMLPPRQNICNNLFHFNFTEDITILPFCIYIHCYSSDVCKFIIYSYCSLSYPQGKWPHRTQKTFSFHTTILMQ